MSRDASEIVRVTPENWRRLNRMKEPGDTFNDVVGRLLDEAEDEGNPSRMTPSTTAD